jgi:hypothetical protein
MNLQWRLHLLTYFCAENISKISQKNGVHMWILAVNVLNKLLGTAAAMVSQLGNWAVGSKMGNRLLPLSFSDNLGSVLTA